MVDETRNSPTKQQETDLLMDLYRYQDSRIREGFRVLAEARSAPPNMMFFHFDYAGDPRQGRFVNPLDIVPDLDAGKNYELGLQLVTLHVDDLIERLRVNKDKPLEHRLYTSVPLKGPHRRGWLDWIVTSAIDVFLEADREGRDKKLQAFTGRNTPTDSLSDQEKIVIKGGSLSLAQGLWGHKKSHWFSKFWGFLSQTLSSPLVAAAGLPALLPTAVSFVNKVLGDYEKEAELQTLWQTKSLDFRISPAADGAFGMKRGYWTLISTDYVSAHPDLEKHKVDFNSQTFEILDPNDRPIRTPYLVSRVELLEVAD